MNTSSVKRDLLNGLKADSEFRHAWNLENVYTGLCFQIRAMREQRGWSQVALGKTAKMAQERISILEDPNAETKPTLNTLLRIADAFDVGLEVRFVPYSTILDRSTDTDFKKLEVPSFGDELPDLEKKIERKVGLRAKGLSCQPSPPSTSLFVVSGVKFGATTRNDDLPVGSLAEVVSIDQSHLFTSNNNYRHYLETNTEYCPIRYLPAGA